MGILMAEGVEAGNAVLCHTLDGCEIGRVELACGLESAMETEGSQAARNQAVSTKDDGKDATAIEVKDEDGSSEGMCEMERAVLTLQAQAAAALTQELLKASNGEKKSVD